MESILVAEVPGQVNKVEYLGGGYKIVNIM